MRAASMNIGSRKIPDLRQIKISNATFMNIILGYLGLHDHSEEIFDYFLKIMARDFYQKHIPQQSKYIYTFP